MDAARWQRVQTLFLAARELAPAERAAWLASHASADAALIDDVRALLAADAESGVLDALGARLPSIEHVVSAPAPQHIGAYRIVRELGRGGMGAVYLAERFDGQFQHRVAIKLIGSTDPGDPLHQRFLSERRILAGLQHPNIARLLDGGITTRGLPYLVMEYVDGVPITEYCDARRLDVRDRLRLFVDVCAAVQHAHRNLVIHRDLKPSNILVSADGRVHLLDFGIAKLLDPDPGAAPEHVTRIERAMTPGYASPEQVRGDVLSTASDVYSLGTLLFELLTGSIPFEVGRSTAELLEDICTRDAERPSTRVIRADRSGAAAARSTTAQRLRRQLEGDLDSIVAMALRKEPARRYASVDLLREDIERHLRGFAVLAHRGTRRYRFEKLVRRHRTAFVAAALVLLSLVCGLGVALWQARAAGLERDRAELALAQSQEITDFLVEMFRTGEAQEPADAVTALDLLRRGVARADRLAGQPPVQARLLDVLGQLSTQLGRYDDAQRMLEQALAIRRVHPGPDSLDLATSLIHLAHVHRSRTDNAQAYALVEKALAIRRRALTPDDPELAAALYELGWVTYGAEQEQLYRESLAGLRRTGARPELQLDLLNGLATNLRRRGDLQAPVALDREALAFAERAFGPDDANTGYAMIHLADQVADLEGDADEAERLYRRGLELMRRQLGDAHIERVHGLNSLARLLSERGAHAEADSLLRHVLAIRIAATGPEHPQAAEGMRVLADQLGRSGHFEEADSLAREALRLARRVRGPDHPSVAALFLPVIARVAEHSGRMDEADRVYREALAASDNANLTRDFARFLIRRGKFPEAESRLLGLLQFYAGWEQAENHPAIIDTRRALMELYVAWGRPEDVERFRVPAGRFVAY